MNIQKAQIMLLSIARKLKMLKLGYIEPKLFYDLDDDNSTCIYLSAQVVQIFPFSSYAVVGFKYQKPEVWKWKRRFKPGIKYIKFALSEIEYDGRCYLDPELERTM